MIKEYKMLNAQSGLELHKMILAALKDGWHILRIGDAQKEGWLQMIVYRVITEKSQAA